MKRFALNFICKNESHIIDRMLESVLSFTDLIVAVDTGSTDNTIAMIYSFGERHKIPTYVFERPFDNFGNSRNFALQKLRAAVQLLHWNLEETWGFRMDCDEEAALTHEFSKNSIDHDLCYANLLYKNYKDAKGRAQDFEKMRQLFFRLSVDFRWNGPVHESLAYDSSALTPIKIPGITIVREQLGASWSENQEEKLLRWITWLKAFIQDGHNEFEWLKYTAEIYYELAERTIHREKTAEYLKQSLCYYEEIAKLDLTLIARRERYGIFNTIAYIKSYCGHPEHETNAALLQAYSMDKRHAEPIHTVIGSYIKRKQWNIAYLYSSFAMSNHHGNEPKDPKMSKVNSKIYQWEILLDHSMICVYSGRLEEAEISLSKLEAFLKEKANQLSPQDRSRIDETYKSLAFSLIKRRFKNFITFKKSSRFISSSMGSQSHFSLPA